MSCARTYRSRSETRVAASLRYWVICCARPMRSGSIGARREDHLKTSTRLSYSPMYSSSFDAWYATYGHHRMMTSRCYVNIRFHASQGKPCSTGRCTHPEMRSSFVSSHVAPPLLSQSRDNSHHTYRACIQESRPRSTEKGCCRSAHLT